VKQIPKEKAEELVSKMLKEVGYDTDLAVPCALIAVDEILNRTFRRHNNRSVKKVLGRS